MYVIKHYGRLTQGDDGVGRVSVFAALLQLAHQPPSPSAH
jgi:hypothetical protein